MNSNDFRKELIKIMPGYKQSIVNLTIQVCLRPVYKHQDLTDCLH